MSKVADYYTALAEDIAKFSDEYDPYGFNDAYDNMDDAVNDSMNLLMTDPGSLLDWLNEALEDMNNDVEFFIDMIGDCEKLIERIKPLTVKRRTYRDGIEAMKAEWVGKEVSYKGNKYTVMDVDYNGALMINKPSDSNCPYHLETTAIGTWMIDKEEIS